MIFSWKQVHRSRRYRAAIAELERRDLPAGLIPPVDLQPQSGDGKVVSLVDSVPPSGTVKEVSNQVYTRDGSALDVYAPARGTPPPGGWPVILTIQGGGWEWARRTDLAGKLAGLTAQGFVVVPVDHIYASPGGPSTWPANIEDVRNAIRWVRVHAAALHVNPDKLVMLGDSSGGHMAALAALLPAGPVSADRPSTSPSKAAGPEISTQVQAVVDFYGPTDLAAEWNNIPKTRPYLAAFLGGSPDQIPGRYQAASPVTYVNVLSPPIYIVQGMKDTTVPVSQSQELADALQAAGVPHQLVVIPKAAHGFMLGLRSERMAQLVSWLKNVLNVP